MTDAAIRYQRIAELLLEEIETIIPLEMNDPRVVNTRVTRVRLAQDMKTCLIYVVVDGSETEKVEAMAALEHARSYIRGQISTVLNMKFTPKFDFAYDFDREKADGVEKTLAALRVEEDPDAPASE
ncbi:MAG: 30S ribosome-binding factor RbfA [Acidobacteria bacterium]|nr:30S ribosome-binding factor RbfA [Acidobacteriota bacterium]